MKTWTTKSGYRIIKILSGRSNVFLLTNGVQNVLIDTSPSNKWDKLEKQLRILNIDHLDYLVLTHTHFDHAGNAFKIREKYQAKVIVHKHEASFLTSGDNIIPKGTNFITRSLMFLFARIAFPKLKYQSCQYDLLVESVLDMKEFGFNANIIHTPGHTIGSMSIVVDDEIAIVGDTMFGVFRWSIFPPFANDIKQMIISWGVLLKTNCLVFIPAHGSSISRLMVQKDYDKRK